MKADLSQSPTVYYRVDKNKKHNSNENKKEEEKAELCLVCADQVRFFFPLFSLVV